jgi:hypothetical protein
MKTIKLTLCTLIFLGLFAFRSSSPQGVGTSGLYLTMSDFLQHQLSYSLDCKTENGKIRLHELFGSSTGSLMYKGKKHVFSKAEVYGYRDCNGQDYRFSGPGAYQILDTAGFYLYSYNKLVRGEKISRPQTVYYFSVTANSPVRELTLENLEKSFPANANFRYRIEGQFRSDKDLIAYDNLLKTYKIKYLFSQASR